MKRGGPMKRSEIRRYSQLRQKTPLRKVNPARKKKLYLKQFGDYADLIRAMACCNCDRVPVDPHHVTSRGAGGDKRDLVPLCRRCHDLLHLMGPDSFRQRFLIDLEQHALELWEMYGEGRGGDDPDGVTGTGWGEVIGPPTT